MPNTCPTAWLNGSFLPLEAAHISPLDRGFLFGDAVYEVIPVYGGLAYRFEEHIARLERSQRELRMEPRLSAADWRSVCGGLIHRNGAGNLLLYLQVSRGVEAERRHVPRLQAPSQTLFGMASRAEPPARDPLQRTSSCITLEDNRWARCDIKSTALLANVMVKWQAEDAGAQEAILLREGWLTEGGSSCVHVLLGDTLVTPPQDWKVLPGTTRDVVNEVAPRAGIATAHRMISRDELLAAPEVMVSAAGSGLRSVTTLDGRPVGDGLPGPVFRRLHQAWLDALPEFSTDCRE